MCLFGYYSYEECGHKGIEVVSYCVERLWKAGMDGQLWPCPEVHYIRNLMELSSLIWEGKYGYCKHCRQTYAMPETASFRSFNDLTVSAERSQPIPLSEDPYIYTPFVIKSIPELLGIGDQIPPEQIREGFKIQFPSNLAIYDRTEAGGSFQWLSQGRYEGRQLGPALSQFSFRNGMTFNDHDLVAVAIMQGRLLGTWREEFESRGMLWERYLQQARFIGERIGVHTLEPNFWEEVGRPCSAEQDNFLGNIKGH